MRSRSQQPILIYDGDCPLCQVIAKNLLAFRIVAPDRIISFNQLTDGISELVWKAGIRNEMIAISEDGAEIRSGIDGLLWALEAKIPEWLIRLLRLYPIQELSLFLYRTIAYNRRFIAPLPRGVACACDPDDSSFYSLSFFAICIPISVFITGLFGASVFSTAGLGTPLDGSLHLIGAAGTGWLILCLLSFKLRAGEQVQYLKHLCATMVAGVSVLVPSILLYRLIPAPVAYSFFAVSVAASFTTMMLMQKKRVRLLGLPEWWAFLWALCLLCSAGSWVAWFLFSEGIV